VSEQRRIDMRGSILFQAATGMRVSELLAVRKSGVNFFAKTVRVDRQMHPDMTLRPAQDGPCGVSHDPAGG
jgi:site-specific recombinase XerD